MTVMKVTDIIQANDILVRLVIFKHASLISNTSKIASHLAVANERAAALQHVARAQHPVVAAHLRFQSFAFALLWYGAQTFWEVFSDKDGRKYGLKITARHPNSSNVASVACKFCIAFGREDNVGATRKRTTNVYCKQVKYWKQGSFRTDNYLSHMRAQRPSK